MSAFKFTGGKMHFLCCSSANLVSTECVTSTTIKVHLHLLQQCPRAAPCQPVLPLPCPLATADLLRAREAVPFAEHHRSELYGSEPSGAGFFHSAERFCDPSVLQSPSSVHVLLLPSFRPAGVCPAVC